MVGNDAETAMAKCVSRPLAHGVTRILAGAMPAGLNRPVQDAGEAERWLGALAAQGVACHYNGGWR
jgi:saccharopine dehydrogenase (NADP+, L-glutamate forming)